MAVDWTAYAARVTQNGVTKRDRLIEAEKKAINKRAPEAPYYKTCQINGVDANLVILSGETHKLKKFYTLPDCAEVINLGSIIYWEDNYWIVESVDACDEINKTGTLRQCNLNLQFQIGDSTTIYSRWCFFDKGVYSTTLSGGETMQTGDVQFKVFLPYDEQTKIIRRDKRLATEILDYPDGHQELSVFKVTATDSVGGSFGAGRLLELKVREDTFDGHRDNIEFMICDYTADQNDESDGGIEWV